jgi:uncharacterized protein (DUF305 family)
MSDTIDDRATQSRSIGLILGIVVALVVGLAGGYLLKGWLVDRSGPNAIDIGFAQDMSVHHDQAVEMAGMALSNSTDPDVRSIAWDIVTSQSNQIGTMRGLLTEWQEPLFATDGYMTWMPMEGHDMAGMEMKMTTMPGMATQDQLSALRAAKGKDFDVQFLTLMTAHHKGGAPMADYAVAHANTDVIRTLAESMSKTQGYEVELMTKMLEGRK